jgi:hypothetical protein
MYESNPKVCMLICGDFNDNPDEPSVTEHLHATGNLEAVRAGGSPPPLFNVFAERWHKSRGKIGTHFYHGQGNIFDQIVVSPAMLNGSGGWACETSTAAIVKHRFMHHVRGRKDHPEHDEPLEFGTVHQKVPLDRRGASDHLPVTVRLMASGR